MLSSSVDSIPTLQTPKISVLLPAFNEEKLIARVLDSVRQSFADVGETAYEIILCDNNSTDRTAEIAKDHGAEVVFEAHNQISRARNKAASVARGDWLIFLDADTFLSGKLLSSTIATLESGRVCGGGSVILVDRSGFGPFGSRMLAFWNAVSRTCRLAAGSYVFCLRKAWESVGGFDERVYAGEELFFSRKIRSWGRKQGMRFVILTEAPIVTSPRKVEWYGGRDLLISLLKLGIPGSLQRRDRCGHWYIRPNLKE